MDSVNTSSLSINRLEPPSQRHRPRPETPAPALPEIPAAELDLTFSFDTIMGFSKISEPQAEKVQKRASNVMKLTQENEKLKEELRAMTTRLEAAERKRQELASRFSKQQQNNTARS
ncbi:hypothetical protein DFJ58DRAFT_753251 [Suillus subalutaceus]|uniref:uncharacterized protein n=1 Tax=Suillus subalutaceus TaxID=48586 RepID=UPI001B8841AF|nr:uncharacterized protein DFJ58DRAFT_753251 [Suillus subalutaceus]KAG1877925.1 hypothetical protein DFJ58DRAFT_753251 [Suillus subalutaceus]KAG1891205.1 hypothetical protein F4604DRAFT_1704897 [Suillus subluteus]